jgi:hypothetical protein
LFDRSHHVLPLIPDTHLPNMSTAWKDIAMCARKISDVVGPCNEGDAKLALCGHSPKLPQATLEDVLPSACRVLDRETHSRVAAAIQCTLSNLRETFARQYWGTVQQLYSQKHVGLPDADVEARLVQMYETRYRQTLDDIRQMLAHRFVRSVCPIDNRNTRGGFGDVNPPVSTQG